MCADGDYNKTFFTTGIKSKHDNDHVEVEFVMTLVRILYLYVLTEISLLIFKPSMCLVF